MLKTPRTPKRIDHDYLNRLCDALERLGVDTSKLPNEFIFMAWEERAAYLTEQYVKVHFCYRCKLPVSVDELGYGYGGICARCAQTLRKDFRATAIQTHRRNRDLAQLRPKPEIEPDDEPLPASIAERLREQEAKIAAVFATPLEARGSQSTAADILSRVGPRPMPPINTPPKPPDPNPSTPEKSHLSQEARLILKCRLEGLNWKEIQSQHSMDYSCCRQVLLSNGIDKMPRRGRK
jgi:hypothetical protein